MNREPIKTLIGDLHRPAVLVTVGLATAFAIVFRDETVILAAGGVLSILYGARSAENVLTRPPAAR